MINIFFCQLFQEMALIVVGTGCFFCFVFHLGTKESPTEQLSDKG